MMKGDEIAKVVESLRARSKKISSNTHDRDNLLELLGLWMVVAELDEIRYHLKGMREKH